MGNWRNRPPRRFFHQNHQYVTPTTSYDTQSSRPFNSSFFEDSVPSWEKQFCFSIGRVPWRKVVDVKTFISGHDNILQWNDLAGKEAFNNAKSRFWAKINGKACEISLPDPDMYIDEINWNADINPEFVKDLESVYFAPAEEEMDTKAGNKIKRLRRLMSFASESRFGNMNGRKNPWEHNDDCIRGSIAPEDKTQGWGQWDTHLRPATASNHKGDNNPWECSIAQANKDVKGSASGCYDKNSSECKNILQGDVAMEDRIKGWNQWDTHVKSANNLKSDDSPWGRDISEGNKAANGNSWDDCGKNPWECSDSQYDVELKNKVPGWNNWDALGEAASDLKSDDNKPPQCCNEAFKGNTWRDCRKSFWEQSNCMPGDVPFKSKTQGMNQWNTDVEPANHLKSDSNTWGCEISNRNNAVNGNSWDDCGKNPWKRNDSQWDVELKNKVQGCNKWDSHVGPADKLKSDDSKPLKRCISQCNEAVKGNKWRDGGKKSWEQINESQGNDCRKNTWEQSGKSQGDDCTKNPWEQSSVSQGGDSTKNPWEQNNKSQGDDCIKNSWEQNKGDVSLKNKIEGWNQWDTHINTAVDVNNEKTAWDCSFSQRNEAPKNNTWGDCGSGWGLNQSGRTSQSKDWNVKDNPWEPSPQVVISTKDKEWGNQEDSCWSHNQQEFGKSNGWGHSQRNEMPKDRRWTNGGESSRNWKERQRYRDDPKSLELRKSSAGWGAWNEVRRKEETYYPNMGSYRSESYQGSDKQTGQYWKRKS